jgi:hypothetical protein
LPAAMLFFAAPLTVQAIAVSGSTQATVNLTGTIASVCSITLTGGGTIALGSSVGVAQSVPFGLNCNQPVTYSVSALNGNLLHDSSESLGALAGNIVKALPYSVQLSVANNAYGQTIAGANVPVGGLLGNAVYTADTAGVAPYTTTGTIAVQRAALVGGQIAVAGTYSDTLTIDVTPSS